MFDVEGMDCFELFEQLLCHPRVVMAGSQQINQGTLLRNDLLALRDVSFRLR
jgi:hypothetical protein